MTQEYKYFVIPYAAVPQDPSCQFWYATWSSTQPPIMPGMGEPMVIGYTTSGELPEGATLIGSSTKDPVPPPPPPPLASTALTDYQMSFDMWLTARRGA